MRKLGIDIGSSYFGAAVLEDGVVRETRYGEHKGDISGALSSLLREPAFKRFDAAGLTSSQEGGGRQLIDNSLAVIEGARFLLPRCRNVFAVGGQSFLLLFFDEEGRYKEHSVNPPCAAGTGSFIEQQAERLKISAAELSRRAASFKGKAPTIATRCAVFAKTDIIHAMQEGHPIEAICAGLCDGIARSVVEALVKGRAVQAPVGMVGGVSLNQRVRTAMEAALGQRIVTPPHAELAGAVGAALLAAGTSLDLASLRDGGKRRGGMRAPLSAKLPGYPNWEDYAVAMDGTVEVFRQNREADAREGIHLGLDIGSTSTKLALINAQEEIVGGFYTATQGEPIEAVKRLLASLRKAFGEKLPVLGACATGSGRKMIKEVFAADMEVNEITAHAEAALHLYPQVDTIIEIGGQDAKFTRLRGGDVYYSTMNYVCAAGTGSFIEEQAKRLGIGLGDFAAAAFGAEAPYTSDRCTVYMERDLAALVGEGWSKGALAAAVLNSVRDNYMAKVVGHSAIGDYVVFQGATARNKALVAAFENLLGKPVHVSPYCHLAGALGAALLSRRKGLAGSSFSLSDGARPTETEICKHCANHCVLTVVAGEGARTGWGMKCGKDYSSQRMARPLPSAPERRFKDAMAPLLAGPQASSARQKTKIGLPAILNDFEYAPLWSRFLTLLGFSVVHEHASKRALRAGRRLVNSDFCAPMIAAHGCVEELLAKGVDYVFAPAIVNERDPEKAGVPLRRKTTDSYLCYYSQYLATILDKLTTMSLKGKLIAPLIAFNDRPAGRIAEDLHRELRVFFPDLQSGEIEAAYQAAQAEFELAKLHLRSGYARLRRDDKVQVAVLGRPYVALDPAMSLDLLRQFEDRGAQVFWQDEFDLPDFKPLHANRLYERMHWKYGKTILKLAEFCARSDNLFPVYISSFRCSPDSFLISYVKDIMGHYGKPFLVLQLDELSSDVGYATRIEAALRSFELAARRKTAPPQPKAATELRDDKPEPGDTVLIPYMDRLISRFWADAFTASGYHGALLESDEKALSTGYRFASGGECTPLVAIAGSAINKVRSENLDPRRAFLYLPTVCLACNFPQYPVFCKLAFEAAGLPGIKVGLINWLSSSDHLPLRLSARLMHGYVVACVIHKIYHRIKPYEAEKGAANEALAWAEREISLAIREHRDLRAALSRVVERFARIKRDTAAARKPRIALLGDLYVKFNDLVNQKLQDLVDELGGELLVPSITEYPLHLLDADARLHGEDRRAYDLLRKSEAQFEKLARELLGEQSEPDFAECVRLMDEYGIKHYIAGETSINVGRALYFIKKGMVDAIIHVNPMFCCPGVVTASIYRKLQEDFGVPIIDIFYDGTGSQNRLLIPHLHYLRRRIAGNDVSEASHPCPGPRA